MKNPQPTKSLEKGFLHVYTGDGKGKTTAAVGLAVRAIGAGHSVFIGQFIKAKDSHEMSLLRNRCSEVDIEQFGDGHFIRSEPTAIDLKRAKEGLERLRQALTSRCYNLVIADEANGAVAAGILTTDELLDLAKCRPANVELVITGRNASQSLIECADLVTEMKPIKHYFDAGVMAREGIEY